MAFDIFDAYATDENLENNGTLFPLGKDSKILVARAGNRKYQRALTKAVDKRRVELDVADGENPSDEAIIAADAVSSQIMTEVLAGTILLGWENMSFKGVDIPYSFENAKKMLAIKDFREMVSGLSTKVEAYKLKREADAGKL